jgi:hypothetical protein
MIFNLQPMKSNIILSCLVVFEIMAFTSCNTLKTTVPPVNSTTPVINLKSSIISIPVEVDIKDLEVKINKDLPGLLYQDNSFEDNNNDNLKLSAWKKENFTFSLTGNELSYRIPLKIIVQIKKIIPLPALTAEIALNFKTIFSINKDWTLTTKTISNGYQWLGSPTIKIGGYEMSIKYIADILLTAGKDMLGKKVDKAIKENLKLKTYLSDPWAQLQKPLLLDQAYNVWLKITPSAIAATQITGVNNKMLIGLSVKAIGEVNVGSVPGQQNTLPVPDLNIVDKQDSRFLLNINTDISYQKIDEIANKELVGQTFTYGKKTITIEKIRVFGSGNKLAVELMMTGNIKGKLFITTIPFYNEENKTVCLKEVEFDVSTKNALLKSANWLLNGSLERLVEKKVSYSIADLIENYTKIINDNLRNNRSIKGVVLNGILNKMDIDNIYCGNESLKVIIFMDGRLNVSVLGLSGM